VHGGDRARATSGLRSPLVSGRDVTSGHAGTDAVLGEAFASARDAVGAGGRSCRSLQQRRPRHRRPRPSGRRAGAGRANARDRLLVSQHAHAGTCPMRAEYPDAHSDAHSPAAEQVRMKYLGVTGPVDRVATGGAGCGLSTVGPPWAETPGVKQGGQAGARRRFCGQSSGLGSRIDGCFEAR
jgi:hypothetical protein